MSILAFILVLGLLVFVHELGHFLIAKWNKVGVLEFAIGFGPILWRRTYGETTYALRAIPLGGFVRMVGDDPRMNDSEFTLGDAKPSAEEAITSSYAELSPAQAKMLEDKSRWFIKKGYFAKMAVVLAGPGFNFIFAFLLAVGFFYFVGKPSDKLNDSPIIGEIRPSSPAEKGGLKHGDLILAINGKPVSKWEEMALIISSSEGKELTLELERKAQTKELPSEKLQLKIVPELISPEEVAIVRGEKPPPSYMIGITRHTDMVPTKGIRESIKLAGEHVTSFSLLILKFLAGMVRGIVSPENIGGPISIFQQTQSSLERGSGNFLMFIIFLNVSLAVFNLLPIPILDGGHLVFFTLEAINRGPISRKFMDRANQVGMFLLLLLMVFAFGNDIRRLWG